MGLTLPGLLGRIFTSASTLFQSSQVQGESFPSLNVFGDGRIYISDGTEDLTGAGLVYVLPEMYVRTRANRLGLVLRGENGGSVRNILEIQDWFGAPIMGVGNTGGIYLNDNLKIAFGTSGPNNIFADIYGHLQLGGQSAIRCSAGPPGNIMTFVDAAAELYQRARTAQQGSWTATNATYSARDEGAGFAPTTFRYARTWTSAASGDIVATTATGTSGYPVPSGSFVSAMIMTRSATVARSKTLSLLFYNAAGTLIGSAIPGTAVTDTTSGYTRLDVQTVSPAGSVYCALRETITGTAAGGEAHFSTAAGIWPGLRTSQVTAWSPPYVYRQDAFGGVSGTGLNDGANVGDVYIRSDGPPNVVQRFWTNAVAGKPYQQKWVSDPRLTSQPARLNWYGGTYLVQGATSNADYTLPNVVTGMLHNDPVDSVNRGLTGAKLLDDSAGQANAGGMATFVQSVKKKTTGEPYVSKDGVFALYWGLWDMAAVTAVQGSGVMSRITAYSAAGGTAAAFINGLRDIICRARASVILEHSASAFTLNGGGNSGTVDYASGGTGPGTGGVFRNYTTTSTGFTFTIPADFEGGAISFSFIGSQGAFGGTVTWSGTYPGSTGTTAMSNNYDAGYRGKVCKRFAGITAANAGQTIICTVTSLDGSGSVGFDCAYLEGLNPNMVLVCGPPRLLNAAAYVTLGGGGSYWNGNAGATGDSDVTTMIASMKSLVAEFDSACVFVDMDAAIAKYVNYYAASDATRFDESGVHAMASGFVDTLNAALPLVDFRNVNHDYHDASVRSIMDFSLPGGLTTGVKPQRYYVDDYYAITGARASVNTAPTGATFIVDVLRNGTTIFTTTANRPTIPISAFTSQTPVLPDVRFLVPGDYLSFQIIQVGSTIAGSDLTVTVLGRKIPVP
jgi:hypothetical protein